MMPALVRSVFLVAFAVAYRTNSGRLHHFARSKKSSQLPSPDGEEIGAEQYRAQAIASASEARRQLNATLEARNLVSRWAAVSGSLTTCVSLGNSLVSASQALGHRLDDLADHVDQHDIGKFVSGDITIRDLRNLPHGGAAETFLRELVLTLRQYDALLASIEPTLPLLGEVDVVAAEEPEHAAALRGMHLFIERNTLLDELQTVKADFAEEHDLLLSAHETLEPFLHDWESLDRMERRQRASRRPGRTWRKVKDLGLAWQRVDNLRDEMDIFVRDIASAFGTWSSVANAFTSPKGSLEVIDASLCSDRHMRTFSSHRQVDDSTMHCDESVLTKECGCARPERDCYVSSENRPEPSDMKRCFRRG